MAKGEIEFFDDDEEENFTEEDMSFDTESFDNEPPEAEIDVQEAGDEVQTVTNKTEDVQKDVKNDKKIEREVEKQLKGIKAEAAKAAKDGLKAETTEKRRDLQDQARTLRRQKHKDMRQATQRRKEIRSQSTQNKISTYALASAMGLPGYVIASIADKFVFKPQEDKDIAAEVQYQGDYQSYINEEEDKIIEQRRQIEDEERASIDISFENEDEVRQSLTQEKKGGVPASGSPTPRTTSTRVPFPSSAASNAPGASNPPPPVLPTNPINQPLPGSPTTAANTGGGQIYGAGFGYYNTQTGNSVTPPTNPVANPSTQTGNAPPTNPPGNTTPTTSGNVPPTPPTPGGADVPGLLSLIPIIKEGMDMAVHLAKGGGEAARGVIDATFEDSGTKGLSKGFQAGVTATESIPIVGQIAEVFAQPMVEAVKTFEQAVNQFESFANKDLGFSPDALQSSVESKIAKLVQAISIGEKANDSKAAIIEGTTKLDMIWAELKADVVVAWTPILTAGLEILAAMAILLKGIIGVLNLILIPINYILEVLTDIRDRIRRFLGIKPKAKDIQGKILKEIELFHTTNPRKFNAPNPRKP